MKTKLKSLLALALSVLIGHAEAANPTVVYLLDAGSTPTEGWTTINKNGSYPAFLQEDTTYNSMYVTSTGAGNFFNTYLAPSRGFAEGSYLALNGTTYSSVLEEMANSLGLESIPASVYSDNLTNGGTTGHIITVNGLDADKTYVMYYIGGANKPSQTVAGFTLKSDGYSGIPKVEYVCTSGNSSHNTSTVTEYTSVPVTTAMRAAADGYLLVRVSYIQPTTSGTISFTLNGERANICALAIAEIDPLAAVTTPVAQVGETKYETLEAAFEAAATMTGPVTVTLLKDVGSEAEAAPVVSIPEGFNGTLDLGDKTLYSRIEASKAMVALTVKNGKILHRTATAAAIDIKQSGLLTLEDVYLETSYHGVRLRKNAQGVINSGDYRLVATSSSSSYNLLYLSDAPASGDSASLVINGGDFYSRYMGTPYVMIRALIGEVVINDGVFHAILPGTTSQTWCIASETLRPIYINGGDFREFSKTSMFKDSNNSRTKEVYYEGGKFSFDPVADATSSLHLGQMVAGYHAVMLEGDDFYTVVKKPAIEPDGSIEVEAADADAAVDKVEILIPEGVTGVDAAAYAAYFTKNAEAVEGTTDKWTVTAALNPEVVTPKITAISFDGDKVTVALETELPGLCYAVRSASEVDKVDSAEATVTPGLNPPATGDAAFYRVLVDFKEFSSETPVE